MYIDGLSHSVENIVSVGNSETITIEYNWNSGQIYKLKVVDKSGLMAESTYKAPFPNWFVGWAKRLKVTIDCNDIDSELTDFPVLVHLSASSGINADDVSFIFDEVGSNSKKIAVTTSDGTECYVEVEEWDSVNEQAWLWVKVPSISHTTDTDLYIYYDTDQEDNIAYVGDPNSTPAENVWDNNFKLVTHMKDDPDTSSICDSTSNNNDGTKLSANNPIQTDGISAKAQDFSADNINYGTDSTLNIVDTLTIEAWINQDSLSSIHTLVGRGYSYWFFMYYNQPAFLSYRDGDVFSGILFATATIPTGTYTHVALVYDTSDPDEVKFYVNGELNNQGSIDGPINNVTPDLELGNWLNNYGFDGIIDEAKISNTSRSGAWIRASYENERDAILSFGFEETT